MCTISINYQVLNEKEKSLPQNILMDQGNALRAFLVANHLQNYANGDKLSSFIDKIFIQFTYPIQPNINPCSSEVLKSFTIVFNILLSNEALGLSPITKCCISAEIKGDNLKNIIIYNKETLAKIDYVQIKKSDFSVEKAAEAILHGLNLYVLSIKNATGK